MAEEGSAPAAATATMTVVLPQVKDPGTFCGTDNVDIEEWLPMYERTSKNYRWDDTLMLANILFYLKGTANSVVREPRSRNWQLGCVQRKDACPVWQIDW